MSPLRRWPPFVTVGLACWLVLFVHAPSRPLLSYRYPLLAAKDHPSEPITWVTVVLWLASAAQAVGGAWLMARMIRGMNQVRGLATAVRLLLIPFFAATIWIMAAKVIDALRGGYPIDWSALPAAPLAVPYAFTFFGKSTWIVFPLTLAADIALRRALPWTADAEPGSAS